MLSVPEVADREQDSRKHPRLRAGGVCGLLFVHAALLAWSAFRQSPTIDEVKWLPAGLEHWQTGTFSTAIVNPPLVRMVAAVPVLYVLAQDPGPTPAPGSPGGPSILLQSYGARLFGLFSLGRWACIPFSLVGGYVCYCWARALYGTASGFLALVL